jgi:hypothetical protein
VNYREALAWLYATQRFGIKLGLENIERLLHSLSIDFARLNLGSARLACLPRLAGNHSVSRHPRSRHQW